MTDGTFEKRVTLLRTFQHNEKFRASFCALYTTCSDEQRAELRRLVQNKIIDDPQPWSDPLKDDKSPARRQTFLRQSLIMLSASNGLGDDRDDLLAVSAVYHDLLLLNDGADAFLTSIAKLSDNRFGTAILNFTGRSSKEKSLKTWCLRLVQTPDGPIAESTW